MKLGLLLVVLAAGAMVPWAQQSPQGKGAQGKEQGKGAPRKKQPRKQSLEKADVPQPPQGKQDEPLPAILEPARGPAERRDLVQKFRARHRLEGIYRLRKMIVKGGSVIKGARGYLFMGHRHMSMQLYAPSNRRSMPTSSPSCGVFGL